MEVKVFFRTIVLSTVLLVSSLAASAHSYDGNLIYNAEERDGLMIGQTVYKMDGSALANYMKYNYKYDNQQRMTESEAMRWNSNEKKWENDLRITYTYAGKSVTTNYSKWDSKKGAYILAPEMTVTMDNTSM